MMNEPSKITVRVRLFAIARAAAGDDDIQLELPSPAAVSDVRQALIERLPELAALANTLRFAVNEDYAADETTVCRDDEVACIPPVSGG